MSSLRCAAIQSRSLRDTIGTGGQQVDHLLQEKLRRRLASVEVKLMNAPRKGKKVVVLDIVSVVCRRCERQDIAVRHMQQAARPQTTQWQCKHVLRTIN
jgi:hypothetical protein